STLGFGESLNQSFFGILGTTSACVSSALSILSSKVCSTSSEAFSNTGSYTGSSAVTDLPDLKVLARDLPLDDSLVLDVFLDDSDSLNLLFLPRFDPTKGSSSWLSPRSLFLRTVSVHTQIETQLLELQIDLEEKIDLKWMESS
nr:hypothetical protein [Tanacetum cinerariifolium]